MTSELSAAPALPGKVRDIMAQVCAENGMSLSELLGSSKLKSHALARFIAIHRVWSEVKVAGRHPSLPQLGRWFNRDHSTAHNALRRYAELGLGNEPDAPAMPSIDAANDDAPPPAAPPLSALEDMSTDDLKRLAFMTKSVLAMRSEAL